MSATKVDPAAEPQDEGLAFVKTLDGLDTQVQGLIVTYNRRWEALRQLQDSADKQSHTKGFEGRLEAAGAALKEAETALKAPMRNLNEAAEDLLHCVYVLASRRKNPAIFYGKSSNSLASAKTLGENPAQEERTARRKEEQEALDGIDQVAISSGDTVKEINRLLDHTSTKRMAEEMDIVTYQSNAKRLFDRIQAEFNQAQASFTEDQGKVRKMREAINGFGLKSDNWVANLPHEIDATGSTKSMLASTDGFNAATDALRTAYTFLVRYDNFLDYAKGYAGSVGREFYTEASVEAFKDATRLHARRIEQQGLFSSYWTMGMALASAMIVAIVLIYLDNNLALKNWIIPVTGTAAAIGYIASLTLGRHARDGIMGDLRRALFESVSQTVDEPPTAGEPPPDRRANREVGRRSDDYFKFRKLLWKTFDKTTTSAAPSSPVTESSASLAKTLIGVSTSKWPIYENVMRRRNVGVLAAIAAVTVGLSLLTGSLDPRKSFAFISRTDELGSCVLERGRVLVATGGSYFVSPQESGSVTEIAKSLVLRIEPSEAATTANPTAKPDLPNCDERSDVKAPDQAALVTATDKLTGSVKAGLESVAKQIGTGQDNPAPLANLVGATKDLADNVKGGLDAVAGKLGTGTGQAEPVSLAGLVAATNALAYTVKAALQDAAKVVAGSPAPPGSGGSAPIVVPIIIDAPPADAPDMQAGPTFITQVYTTDGKVHDYGSGVMMLPIFLDPVVSNGDKQLGGDNGAIDTTQEAFFFGARSLSDPKLPDTGAKRKLLHEIASSYATCMAKAKDAFAKAGGKGTSPKLTLRIEGYASEKWETVNDPDQRKNLNLYLAEGRRNAVIQALEADAPSIEIEPKPVSLAFNRLADVDTAKVKGGFEFDSYSAMEASLAGKVPGGSQPEAPVDLLRRSVVISVDGELPEQCRPKAG
jgi:hypothetical protein